MKIIPALDFLDGKIVRLQQGQYDQVTHFNVELPQLVEVLHSRGIDEVHCVNLSAARNPDESDRADDAAAAFSSSLSYLSSAGFRIQTGGGIRNAASLENARRLGADRVVVGTWAWENIGEFTQGLRSQFSPATVIVGFDVRFDVERQDLRVAVHGWKKELNVDWRACLGQWQNLGVSRFLCTEISRDGMMNGPHMEFYRFLLRECPGLELQASGGVRGAADIQALSELGAESVLIGRSWLQHWQEQKTLPEWIRC